MRLLFFLLLPAAVLLSGASFGWIYPEHRDIAIIAIQKLHPENRKVLDELWKEARMGHEDRLTEYIIDTVQTTKPAKLDYAAWPAIAGDHSRSSSDMIFNVLKTDWILKVANIAAQLKIDLSNSKTKSQRINAIRDSDINLQRADLEYATRAGTNNVHFLLARTKVDVAAAEYFHICYAQGAELNAIGAYSWFHTSAINKAIRYSRGNLNSTEKSELMLSALADEAFALHFLEDMFAAGHIAGTWGKASLRKGTHDFYNENGIDATTWNGKRMTLMGDAYLRDEDAEVTANIVRMSIEQFISATQYQNNSDDITDQISLINQPDTFNICLNNLMPARKYDQTQIDDILINTPVPALSTGAGELPRFRSELGMFLGVSGSLNSFAVDGGFGKNQTEGGAVGGIEENIRLGFGIEGVLNEAGDGLVFIQIGLREDGAATNQIVDGDNSSNAGNITSAIPSRSAYNLRFRMPFCLIPGDLLFTAPILLIVSPKTLTKMAIAAGNGGLIPWQSGIATSIGRFQFVLGREVGVSFYGVQNTNDVIFVPDNSYSFLYLLEYKSTKFDFPFLEYRPFRMFSKGQSSSLIVQFSAGVDIPYVTKVLVPAETQAPELKSIWNIGMRITFNWRHYFK